MNKKITALLLVLLMVLTVTVPMAQTDAEEEDDEDNDSVMAKILKALLNGVEAEFTDDAEANRSMVVDWLNAILIGEGEEPVINDDMADLVIGTVSAIVPKYSIDDSFSFDDDAAIGKGSLKAAADIPQYVIDVLSGEDTEVDTSKKYAELGIVANFSIGGNLKADESINRIGISGDANIGSANSLLAAIISIDNPKAFGGLDVAIYEDSVYRALTTLELNMYMAAALNSTWGQDTDDEYLALRIVADINGELDCNLSLKSGTGPKAIQTGLLINNLSLDLVLNIQKSDSGLTASLTVNKAILDAKYGIRADSDYQGTTIRNSSIMALINGATIVISGEDGPVSHDVSLPDEKEIEKARSERSQPVNSIIAEAQESTSQERFVIDRTIPLIVSGILAILGLAIIVTVKVGKKY